MPEEAQRRGGADSGLSGPISKGADFNGNKSPASAHFGDRVYEQRQFDASSLQDEHVTSTEAGSYTVMLYLDGSTLEDPDCENNGGIFGSKTIDQILSSDVDTDRVNVVIMTGGSKSWGFPGLEGNGNYILHVVKDSNGWGLTADVDYHSERPLSMGDPSTLSFFVRHAEQKYPADHYSLIIWNHGGGSLTGCALDENYRPDTLLLPELSSALSSAGFGKSKKFDWIGFDCCLMGDLEVADALSDYSYYMVASQELESLVGEGTCWTWDFLEKLGSTASPVVVAAGIIDDYASDQESVPSGIRASYTMSLVDLTKVQAVKTALDGLSDKMADGLAAGEYPKLARLREYTKEFGEDDDCDLVDLGYMAWTLEEMYPDDSKSLENAINELVLYQRTNVPEASGVSLYYPYRNMDTYDHRGGRELYETYDISDDYLSYLRKFTSLLNSGGDGAAEGIDEPKPENEAPATSEESPQSANDTGTGEYTLQLSDEAQSAIARVSYNVLLRGSDDDAWSDGGKRYRMVLQDCQVAADADGVVHFLKNQTLLTLQGEGDEQIVWPFKQVACGAQTAKYQSLATTADGPFGAMAWTDSTPIAVRATEALGDGDPRISSIDYLDEDDAIGGKSDVDMGRYDYVANWVQPCAPTDDDAKPAWEWKQWDRVSARQIPIDSQLTIGTVKTAELEGDYVLQIVVTDVYGKEHASELYELDSLGDPDKARESIDGVACTFASYGDHAVLTKAEGSADEFSVPSECQGVPVTEIGDGALIGASVKSIVVPQCVETIGSDAFGSSVLERASLPEGLEAIPLGAFYGCTNLSEVNLPQSLQSIGDAAFSRCEHLTALEIPAGVAYIGDGAFERCSRLRSLTVADGNEAFKAELNDDGNVLYTADGTELVACPGLFHSQYSIAEGTERIRDRAFNGCYTEDFSGRGDGSEGHSVIGYGLVDVTFPDTLKEVGDAAFFECNRLKRIDLPEGLEVIGTEAFGSTDLTGTLGGLGSVKFEKDTIAEVAIGKDVRWIGQQAFNSFTVKKFTVDKENRHYSAVNGRLMSKNGKTAIDVYGD